MNQPNERYMLEAIEGSPLGYYVETLSDNLHYAYEEIARLKADLKKTQQSLVDNRFDSFQDDQYNAKIIEEKTRELNRHKREIEEKDEELADLRMEQYSRQSMDFEENRRGHGTKAYWRR